MRKEVGDFTIAHLNLEQIGKFKIRALCIIIDDNREATTINNDHNLLISIVKANYQKVKWQEANGTKNHQHKCLKRIT